MRSSNTFDTLVPVNSSNISSNFMSFQAIFHYAKYQENIRWCDLFFIFLGFVTEYFFIKLKKCCNSSLNSTLFPETCPGVSCNFHFKRWKSVSVTVEISFMGAWNNWNDLVRFNTKFLSKWYITRDVCFYVKIEGKILLHKRNEHQKSSWILNVKTQFPWIKIAKVRGLYRVS